MKRERKEERKREGLHLKTAVNKIIHFYSISEKRKSEFGFCFLLFSGSSLGVLVLLSIFSLFIWSVDCNQIERRFNTTMQKSGRAMTLRLSSSLLRQGQHSCDRLFTVLHSSLSPFVPSVVLSFLFIGIHVYN